MLAAKPHRWPLFPDSLQEYPLLNSMTCAEKDAALFSRHIEEPSVSSTKDQFTMQDPCTQFTMQDPCTQFPNRISNVSRNPRQDLRKR